MSSDNILPATLAIVCSLGWFGYLLVQSGRIKVSINDRYKILLPSAALLLSPFFVQVVIPYLNWEAITIVDILRLSASVTTAWIAWLAYSAVIKNKLQEKQLEVILESIHQIRNFRFTAYRAMVRNPLGPEITFNIDGRPYEAGFYELVNFLLGNEDTLFLVSHSSLIDLNDMINAIGLENPLLPKKIAIKFQEFDLGLGRLNVIREEFKYKDDIHDLILWLLNPITIVNGSRELDFNVYIYRSHNDLTDPNEHKSSWLTKDMVFFAHPSRKEYLEKKFRDLLVDTKVITSSELALIPALDIFDELRNWLSSRGIEDLNLPQKEEETIALK